MIRIDPTGIAATAVENKIYSRELVDVVFEQPYCRITNVVDSGIAKRQTASEYLKKLVGIGVLEERQIGRERLFLHPKLVTLVTQEGNDYQEYWPCL